MKNSKAPGEPRVYILAFKVKNNKEDYKDEEPLVSMSFLKKYEGRWDLINVAFRKFYQEIKEKNLNLDDLYITTKV